MLANLAQVQGAADQITLLLGNDIGPLYLAGIRQFTSDRLENVSHGQQADEVTELVDDKRNVRRLFTHLFQSVENREAVQQIDGLARHRLQIRFMPRQQLLEQLLFMHKAQGFIYPAIPDQGQPGVR